MLGITHIKADGTQISLGRKHLTLKDAQALVGGLIELVVLPNQDPSKIGDHVMWVNEEGLLNGLFYNATATAMAGHDGLVGDAIVTENEESDFSDGEESMTPEDTFNKNQEDRADYESSQEP